MGGRVPVVALAAGLLGGALALPAAAEHGATYRGHYANAFVVGETARGDPVTVMGGFHDDFTYHDPESHYDEIAIQVGDGAPVVITVKPGHPGFRLEPGEGEARISYAGRVASFDLRFESVRHTPRYQGDPAQLGDFFLRAGYDPQGDSPGFIYTPHELRRLVSGSLSVRGRAVSLARMHGQLEEGAVDAPTDREFRSAYDYLAAPTADRGEPYTYVGFSTHALHPGSPFDSYFRSTASDEMTMEGGTISDGNTHGAPSPFENRATAPDGARLTGQWATDLGPGILYRKLVRLRDREGRELVGLSETIVEDPGEGPDATRPVVERASLAPRRLCSKRRSRCRRTSAGLTVRASEPGLVTLRSGSWTRALSVAAGTSRQRIDTTGLRRGRRSISLRLTDEAGNRSRGRRLRVRVR